MIFLFSLRKFHIKVTGENNFQETNTNGRAFDNFIHQLFRIDTCVSQRRVNSWTAQCLANCLLYCLSHLTDSPAVKDGV